jgi:nitroreductase/NAD-dependent dihydropyrimidine dehydrogenase PreA subunit
LAIFKINEKTCTKCGTCAGECPSHLIIFQPGQYPRPLAAAESFCLGCGHCVAICPTGSLSHKDSPVEKSFNIQNELKVTPEQCGQLLKSRRSVRVFKDQSVPRDIVIHLIQDARYAPTGHNNQEVEWLVIDSREELNRIEELGTGWIRWSIENNPRMAKSFDMPEMLRRQEQNHNIFLRGCPVLLVAHAIKENVMAAADASSALAYLDLEANCIGLGTCWAGFVLIMANNFPPVKAAIALPEGHSAYGCMMLGYNKYKYQRIPLRKEARISWR